MTRAELAAMRIELESWTTLIAASTPVAHIEDIALAPGLSARVYEPEGSDDAVLVWLHGGGYVSGTLDAIDPTCRWLAARLGSTVVSVEYRLAPEHPFPAAVEDAVAAISAVAARFDGPIAIGGDSAGGGLATAAARLTEVPLVGVLLLCPWLDLTVRPTGVTSDLTLEALNSFAEMYVGSAGDVTDPRASPLLAPDPPDMPTVIVAAEHDSLGYQAVEYADRLEGAGTTVELRIWPFDHGFVGNTKNLPEAREALDWAADTFRGLLTR